MSARGDESVPTPLHATTAADIAQLGGKGAGLARLIAAGFPVPDTWVIAAPQVALLLERPDQLASTLETFWIAFAGRWPGQRLAVRSSALAEDTEQASFAGVYQTVLNVADLSALIAAVRHVLDGVHSAAAQQYRERTGYGTQTGFALLLQRMVDADRAGVLMTANPQHPLADDEMVVEAAYGLGEAVVSGLTDPDRHVLGLADGTVRQQRLGRKQCEIRWSDGRHRQLDVETDRRQAWALSPTQLTALHHLARRVHQEFGPRQDIEFAFDTMQTLYLLQLRPMTGLPPVEPHTIWSRRFGDEYLADYTMPLSYSMLGAWIRDVFMYDFAERFGFRQRLTEAPMIRHEGYAYASGLYVAELLSALPASLRSTEAIAWFPPQWDARIRSMPWRPAQLLRMLRTTWQDPTASLERNPELLAEHTATIEQQLVPLLAQDYRSLSAHQWQWQLDQADALGRRHFEILRWGMGFHNPVLHSLLQRALRTWCAAEEPSTDQLYADLLGGMPEVWTARLNRELWSLAVLAAQDPRLAATLPAGHGDVPALRSRLPTSPFWPRFDDFMARYGHRSSTREISAARWRETPGIVLGLIAAQLPAAAADPAALARREDLSAQRRSAATAQALRCARGALHSPAGAARAAILRRLIAYTQNYTLYRENQRYYLDYILLHVRQLVREAGRRLVERRLLGDVDDVFLLEAEEFRTLMLDGGAPVDPGTWHARIDQRRAHWLRWHDRLPPLWVIDGVGVEPARETPEQSTAPDGWHATAASRGRVRGTVHVIHDLQGLASIRPGEILVAPNTDPGWTAVFPLLGGLITETGGLLSHGALLAREYGLPAVTGLVDATSLLQSGDRVEIDGGAGTVRRL